MNSQEIQEILTFLQRTKPLEKLERYNSSLNKNQNTVAEHSWRLVLMALVIAPKTGATLDMQKIFSLAVTHDLAEAVVGDADGYSQSQLGADFAVKKGALEDAGMHKLIQDISFGEDVYTLWKEFEDQQTIEARFVKALDKIEGMLHIMEVGVDSYSPPEFYGDYADKWVHAFDASANTTLLTNILNTIKQQLKSEFERRGVIWIEVTPS